MNAAGSWLPRECSHTNNEALCLWQPLSAANIHVRRCCQRLLGVSGTARGICLNEGRTGHPPWKEMTALPRSGHEMSSQCEGFLGNHVFVLNDPCLAATAYDLTDQPGIVFPRPDEFQYRAGLSRGNDDNHPDAHVEDLIKLLLEHVSTPR